MTDAKGEVTYSARYTPWGDTLDTYGTGNFAFGYFGGLMDTATGLLYVGNGQYYDPEIGRFLTRNPNTTNNPYLPFDPTGALFVPLAFASLIYGKKKKKSKWDILVIITLLSLSAGMGVAACGAPAGSSIEATVMPIAPNQAEVTVSVDGISQPPVIVTTPAPPNTIVVAICEEAPTPTLPPSTPTPNDILQIPYPGSPAYDESGAWGKTLKKYKELRDWMLANAPDDLIYSSDTNGYGYRFKDEVLLSIIISVEFITLRFDKHIFNESLGALSNQYVSSIFCNANCDTVEKQLIWLSNKQGIRTETVDWIGRWYPQMSEYGDAVKNGDYSGRVGWEWGNFEKNSAFDKHPENYPNVAYIRQLDGNYAGFVVFTASQNSKCKIDRCVGW